MSHNLTTSHKTLTETVFLTEIEITKRIKDQSTNSNLTSANSSAVGFFLNARIELIFLFLFVFFFVVLVVAFCFVFFWFVCFGNGESDFESLRRKETNGRNITQLIFLRQNCWYFTKKRSASSIAIFFIN